MLYVFRAVTAAGNDYSRLSAQACSRVVPTCRIAHTEGLIGNSGLKTAFVIFPANRPGGQRNVDSPLGEYLPAEILR